MAGCDSQVHGRDVDTLIATRYQNNRLTVSTDIEETNSWIECFSIDICLPTHYYFGFTAATGQRSDNHDIVSVHTYRLESSEQRRKEDRIDVVSSAPLAKVGQH
jgi:mannose-binding lectin 2